MDFKHIKLLGTKWTLDNDGIINISRRYSTPMYVYTSFKIIKQKCKGEKEGIDKSKLKPWCTLHTYTHTHTHTHTQSPWIRRMVFSTSHSFSSTFYFENFKQIANRKITNSTWTPYTVHLDSSIEFPHLLSLFLIFYFWLNHLELIIDTDTSSQNTLACIS